MIMTSRKTTSMQSKSYTSMYASKAKPKSKEKANEEMKSMMNHRHQAVYHRSAFTVSDLNNTSDFVAGKSDEQTMCRICQSTDDSLANQQVTPCSCSGSLQYVHMQCLQRWRQTKKLSGADVSFCELCKQPYNVQLLGSTDVTPDRIMKMQEDLKQLVKSGIYLMLLMRTWKTDIQNAQAALQSQNGIQPSPSNQPVSNRPSVHLQQSFSGRTVTQNPVENGNTDTSSSDDNEEYVSRQALKDRTARIRRREKKNSK